MALKSSRARSNSAAVDPTLMTDKNYGGGGGGSLSGNEAELAEVEQFMSSGDGIEGVENNYDLFGVVNHLGKLSLFMIILSNGGFRWYVWWSLHCICSMRGFTLYIQ